MGTRKLADGTIVEELDKACNLTVYTKCPEKWMLIDLETGQIYIGNKSEKWEKVKNESNKK